MLSQIKNFRLKVLSGDVDISDWENLVSYVHDPTNTIPLHFQLYLEDLDRIEKSGVKKDDIKILDHGCGGGSTVLFLLAYGYKNVYGIDIKTHKCLPLNKNLAQLLNLSCVPFIQYVNDKVPINSRSVHYIFSNQVLEHVPEQVIDTYLSEEMRLKHNTCLIRHSFPTRNSFFESHTQTVFLHWFFPRKIFNGLFNKKKNQWLQENLFLRWDSEYELSFKKNIGEFEQTNVDRSTVNNVSFEEKGIKSFLRQMYFKLVANPLTEKAIKKLFEKFATREYVYSSTRLLKY